MQIEKFSDYLKHENICHSVYQVFNNHYIVIINHENSVRLVNKNIWNEMSTSFKCNFNLLIWNTNHSKLL